MTSNMFDDIGKLWGAMLALSVVGIILGIVEAIRLAAWIWNHVRIS